MVEKNSNLDLAQEAGTTADTVRQAELAQVDSAVVLNALKNNPNLDPTLRGTISKRITDLTDGTRAAVEKV